MATVEGQILEGGLNATEDALYFYLHSPPTFGQLKVKEDGTFLYDSQGNLGHTEFTFYVSNEEFYSLPTKGEITVKERNYPPEIEGDPDTQIRDDHSYHFVPKVIFLIQR